jgi:nucleoside 2-deoxyribosyltransferase
MSTRSESGIDPALPQRILSLGGWGDTDTCIIVLTVLDDGTSHERGYFAGARRPA